MPPTFGSGDWHVPSLPSPLRTLQTGPMFSSDSAFGDDDQSIISEFHGSVFSLGRDSGIAIEEATGTLSDVKAADVVTPPEPPNSVYLSQSLRFQSRVKAMAWLDSLDSARASEESTSNILAVFAAPPNSDVPPPIHALEFVTPLTGDLLENQLAGSQTDHNKSNIRSCGQGWMNPTETPAHTAHDEKADQDLISKPFEFSVSRSLRPLPNSSSSKCPAQPKNSMSPVSVPMQIVNDESEGAVSEQHDSADGSDSGVLVEELAILQTTLHQVFGLTLEEAKVPPDVYQPLLADLVKGLYNHLSPKSVKGGTRQTPRSPAIASGFSSSNLTGPANCNNNQPSSGTHGDTNCLMGCISGDNAGLKVATQTSVGKIGLKRYSCPYRKRNPGVFNVRNTFSCSMTWFGSPSQLR